MYVCICNAFTEKQVVRVLSGEALSPAGVYRHLGCTPQCGKCIPSVRSMVKQYTAFQTSAANVTP